MSQDLARDKGAQDLVVEQKKLPTGVRIVIRTVAPLFIGVLSIVLGAISAGSVRYLLFFVTALSFGWYILQYAWLEKEPESHII